MREVFVECLGQGLPGDLKHRLTRNDGSALDIFDAAIDVAVRKGGRHAKESGFPPDFLGDRKWSIGKRDDLRDTLAFTNLLVGCGKARGGITVEAVVSLQVDSRDGRAEL